MKAPLFYASPSNVESTNSMIKAKFGDHLRSKTDVAMVNEALCKVLCHNVCVLIQSHYELGINAEFWGNTDGPGTESALSAVNAAGEPMDVWDWV